MNCNYPECECQKDAIGNTVCEMTKPEFPPAKETLPRSYLVGLRADFARKVEFIDMILEQSR